MKINSYVILLVVENIWMQLWLSSATNICLLVDFILATLKNNFPHNKKRTNVYSTAVGTICQKFGVWDKVFKLICYLFPITTVTNTPG